jgi:putative DNA primase/helicase
MPDAKLMTLTPEAKAAWVAFHDAIEGELRNGGELYDVRDVASKIGDNAVRLAAQFQVFEHGTPQSMEIAVPFDVELDAFDRASRIAAWHLNESRRFFGEFALPPELVDGARLDAWLIEHCRRERTQKVPTKKVQQFGPAGLREKAKIEAAVRELEELGRVRLVLDGRRKEIHVNPALLA